MKTDAIATTTKVASLLTPGVSGDVLILGKNDNVISQLHTLLTEGIEKVLMESLIRAKLPYDVEYTPEKKPLCPEANVIRLEEDVPDPDPIANLLEMQKTKLRAKEPISSDVSGQETLTQKFLPNYFVDPGKGNENSGADQIVDNKKDENPSDKAKETDGQKVYLMPMNNKYWLKKVIYSKRPSFIILYDANMGAIRQIEVYKALNPEIPLKVYFLMYASSTAETNYFTALNKERTAFEALIHEKTIIAVPKDIGNLRDPTPTLRPVDVSTRKGGAGQRQALADATADQNICQVIVDLREFRSELPSLIFKRGIDILPLTIPVADYILTPDTCVERKSVSDLISSLNSGRLYHQAAAMVRNYAEPILLIEFHPSSPFCLMSKNDTLTSDISSKEVSSKLVLLTIHFPKLRIIWTPSPQATAEIFEDLKWNKPEPVPPDDASTSAESQIDLDGQSAADDSAAECPASSLLLKFPGISSKQLPSILKSTTCLYDLAHLEPKALTESVFSEAPSLASKFYNFLDYKPETSADQTSTGADRIKTTKAKRKAFKRKF